MGIARKADIRPGIAGQRSLRPTLVSACVSAVLAAGMQSKARADEGANMQVPDAETSTLEEVIVTATRHAESLIDVPYNISAVTASELQNSGITDMQDLTHMVPGLEAPDLGPRANSYNNSLTIRGLNASSVNYEVGLLSAPVVSTYVDETPLFVNLKLTDIDRVEVLRGPQGTLYGSGSVGGTVRVIHNQPDPSATQLDLTVSSSGTAHADGPSESVDAIFNVPLAETAAFRGSAGYERLSGFTDALSVAVLNSQNQPVLADPAAPLTSLPLFTQQHGIDSSYTWYARGAALWKLTDAVTATVTYQHQTDHSDGFSQQRPGYELAQTLYSSQPADFNTDLGSFDVAVDFGFASLSSNSSFTNKTVHATFDETGLIESLVSLYDGYPRIVSPFYDTDHNKSFTEEIRLASKSTEALEWVLGGYFNHLIADSHTVEPVLGIGSWSEIPGSGRPAGCMVESVTCPYPTYGDVVQFYNGGIRPSLNPYPDLEFEDTRTVGFRDLAAFGETSYHLTSAWQVTGGARLFWQHYQIGLDSILPECGVICSDSGTNPEGLTLVQNEKAFRNQIFKLNTSYKLTPRTLLYLTWSEGFRHGGANVVPIGSCYFCEPKSLLTYAPDTVRNTELGIKGTIGPRSSYTFTVYNIDWARPQIEGFTRTGGFDFVTNGVSARSRGAEAELDLRLAEPLTMQLGYSYTDAKLTASFVQGYDDAVGVSGDQLPNVSRQQVTAALEYSHPFADDHEVHARLDSSYRSSFWTALPSSPLAQDLPAITLLNARLGVTITRTWRIDAFVDNIANRIFSYAVSTVPGPEHDRADNVGRPRTAGLRINYDFRSK